MPSMQWRSEKNWNKQQNLFQWKFINLYEVNLWLIHIQMIAQKQISKLNIKWLLDYPGFCLLLLYGQAKAVVLAVH